MSMRTAFSLPLLLAFVACDGETPTDTGSTDDPTAVPTDDTAVEPAEPLFGVVSVPPSTDGTTTSYVILTDELTGTVDPADADLELSGRALATTYDGQVFVGTSTSGELTRYDVVDGALVENGRANFGAQQVTGFAGYSTQLQVVDADTGYWFGRDGRIVRWNPSDLTVVGAIDLPGMIRPDPENEGTNYTTSLTGAPIWSGTDLISFVSWDSRTGGVIKVPGASGVIVVDTTNDTAEFIVDDSGCGYGRDGVIDGNWLYIATEAVGTSVHHLDPENGPTPCLRRFDLTTKTFDADFTVDLNALTGGPTGSLVTTADGQALLHVLDADAAAAGITDGSLSNPRALSSAELWKTVALNVGDTPTVTELDVPLRSASVLPHTLLDGVRVTPTFGDQPQILEVTAAGIVGTDAVEADVTGFTSAVFQIQ